MDWINELLNVAKNTKKQKQFLWMAGGILFIFWGYKLYETGDIHYPLLIIASGCFLISFISAILALPILFVWLLFGKVMGEITSTIILFIIYYFVFAPLSLILNMSKKDISKPNWIERKNKEINYKKLY